MSYSRKNNDSKFDSAHSAYEKGCFEQAFELFLEAAKAGDTSAMSRLALMYGDGEGVPLDQEKSIYWDKKTIDAGSTTSMANLAVTYRMRGDIKEAKKWFKKALDSGFTDVGVDLAKLYINTDKKYETARALLRLVLSDSRASQESHEEAQDLLKAISKEKGPEIRGHNT